MRKSFTEFSSKERASIARLRRFGQSPGQLADAFGASPMTIRKIYQTEVFS